MVIETSQVLLYKIEKHATDETKWVVISLFLAERLVTDHRDMKYTYIDTTR